MDVDRGMWWSVWWPWATVWIITVVAALVAVVGLLLAWRARRRYRPDGEVPDLTFYLHGKSVMNLYQSGGYGDALEREVEERVNTTKDGRLALQVYGVEGSGGRTSGREVVRRYITNDEPIAVIGVLLKALKSEDGVVHVNLRDRTIGRSTALEQALAASVRADTHHHTARLRMIDRYVSVKGAFRLVQQNSATSVFLAPYGDPDDPAEGPQVRLECHNDGLSDDVIPDGTFQARCLGKVQSWRSGDGELVIHPIAIFR